MTMCSPYLLRPLRTLRQACSDISASHPELIPPGFDVCANAEKDAEHDYSLAIKNKGRPPKPWRWEIYLAADIEKLRLPQRSYPNGQGGISRSPRQASPLTAVIGPSHGGSDFLDLIALN